MKILLSFLMVLLFVSSSFAIPSIPIPPVEPTPLFTGDTLYVDGDDLGGSDAPNDCQNPAAPCLHVNYAITKMSAGDKLIIHETAAPYNEKPDVYVSGNSSNWIWIEGAAGESPEISYGSGYTTFDLFGDYIYVKNLTITESDVASDVMAVWIRGGATHIFLEDIQTNHGMYVQNAWLDGGSPAPALVSDVYVKNCNFDGKGDNDRVVLIQPCQIDNLTFVGCSAYNGYRGGFGSGLATWGVNKDKGLFVPEYHGTNIYFVDCVAHTNGSSGFVVGLFWEDVLLQNCISYNNDGSGFKIYAANSFMVNCLAYDNDLVAVDIKPMYNTAYYILNCTFVDNGSGGSNGAQIRSWCVNDGYYLTTAHLYMYNTILSGPGGSNGLLYTDHWDNLVIEEENYNYWFVSASGYGYKDYQNCPQSGLYHSFTTQQMDGSNGAWTAFTGGQGDHDIGKDITQLPGGVGFVDQPGNNFNLALSSLAVDVGTDIGIDEDIEGITRPVRYGYDIGAYEYHNCTVDGDCTNGLYCDGYEHCIDNLCAPSGNPCSGGSECNNCCDEINDDCFCDTTIACTNDGNPCTDDLCNHAGSCAHTANADSCDDDLWCNGTDTCAGGICTHTGNPCNATCENCNDTTDECDISKDSDEDGYYDGVLCAGNDCDDSNPLANLGQTEGPLPSATCSDGFDNNCNGQTDGADANCLGGPDECTVNGDCADANDCTIDICDAGACRYEVPQPPCTDGVFCNGPDTCLGGVCSIHLGNPCDPWYTCNEGSDACDATGNGWTVPDMDDTNPYHYRGRRHTDKIPPGILKRR